MNHHQTLPLLSKRGLRFEAGSTLHQSKNKIPTFFKFFQKKVSRLDKRNFLHLLNECRGLATCFLQITTPQTCLTMCRSFFVKPENFFMQKHKKWLTVIFWANVMQRQSCVWASRSSSAQKSQGWRVVYSKNFSRATFFIFWVT